MDTKPRIIIEVDAELLRRLKHWAIDNQVSIAHAGRAMFQALVEGEPAVVALVKPAAEPAPKPKRAGKRTAGTPPTG